MGRPALLLHSSGPQGPGEGSAPLAERLRDGLGSSYDVIFPALPDPDEPHYEPWSNRLGEVLGELDDPFVVIGHSLGGSVALKHLSESDCEAPITGLVLIATPFWGEQGWEAEWALPKDWPNATTKLPPTFLFHSRDDEELPLTHLERYAERLPDATVRALDGNGHLFERGDLTEVLEAIRSLSAS
jgi:predicted alpha/beta hydrolase family esterase